MPNFGYCVDKSGAARTTTVNSQRTLARNPIKSYALPGEECLAYNKVQRNFGADRVVLLVHAMQNCCVDLSVDRAPLLANISSLVNTFRCARLPVFSAAASVPNHASSAASGSPSGATV